MRWSRVLGCLLLVSWFSVLGCAPENTQSPETSNAGALAGFMVEEDLVAGVAVDSVWRQLTPDMNGSPAQDREGLWVIQFGWLRVPSRPESLYTYEDMFRLEDEGVIDENTILSPASYRFGVEARDLEEATAGAVARMEGPDWPPQVVYDSMPEKQPGRE